MKKIFLILALVIISFDLSHAEQNQETDKIKIQVEQYEQECYNKAYPVNDSEKMDYIFSYYNDNVKEYLPKYNQCLKEIIIEKIKKDSSPSDTQELINALDKIEQGILDFYGIMYAQTDTGIVGKATNDNELGRRYEEILYDVLHYQSIYSNNPK